MLKTLEAGKSDLPESQKATALACMQNAVMGTSFPQRGERHQRNLLDRLGLACSYTARRRTANGENV